MILGIHHTAISIRNMEKALAFYCDVLGFEVTMKGGWKKGSDQADQVVGGAWCRADVDEDLLGDIGLAGKGLVQSGELVSGADEPDAVACGPGELCHWMAPPRLVRWLRSTRLNSALSPAASS